MEFPEALEGLRKGDFTRLESALGESLVLWVAMGLFEDHPAELAESLAAASFNGQTQLVANLLDRGVDPASGTNTGMSSLHWAANRGQIRTVRLLVERGAPLEAKNRYGGTVLSCAVWSAINEPKDDHLDIIQTLLDAGADRSVVATPTGNRQIDELL